MAGTLAGGRKAAQTNLKKHGKDFYKRIGKKGGQNGHTGGFASNIQLAKEAGRKGGKKRAQRTIQTPQTAPLQWKQGRECAHTFQRATIIHTNPKGGLIKCLR